MISVLLPTFNSDKHLSQSIQSILNQTFTHFEFLIVDDGSTDNTEKIVKLFDDSRIKYIKKEHTGLADTLNYGLTIAKNDWIARMDSDDISHPSRLEFQFNYISQNKDIDWVSCWYAVFDKKLRYIFNLPEKSDDIVKNLILTNSVCFPGSIFRKKNIEQNGGFQGKVYEDYEFLLRAKNKLNFYNIQKVLYYQRQRSESLSRKNYDFKKNIIYKIQSPYYVNLRKEFNLNNDTEVSIYKGWREFIFGDWEKARKAWSFLKINIFLYPKVVIGYVFTFLPQYQFRKLKKIGYKSLSFYSHFIPSKENHVFQQIIKHLNM